MTTRRCSVDGCERFHYAKDLCKMHYWRVWRGKGIGPAQRLTRASQICEINGCEEPARANGLCNRHYHRWLRTGEVSTRSERNEVTCVACLHEDRLALDLAMLNGTPADEICRRFGISKIQRARHRPHIGAPDLVSIRCKVCSHPDMEHLDVLLRSGQRGALTEVNRIVGSQSARFHLQNHLDNPKQAAKIAAFHVARLEAIRRIVGQAQS